MKSTKTNLLFYQNINIYCNFNATTNKKVIKKLHIVKKNSNNLLLKLFLFI
jgi:hypothetical protein